MSKKRSFDRIRVRESVLVDAQCLLQKALNESYGNPRDHEDHWANDTHLRFQAQHDKLATLLKVSVDDVNRLFADDSKLRIKDLAEALYVLGYELKLDIVKKE